MRAVATADLVLAVITVESKSLFFRMLATWSTFDNYLDRKEQVKKQVLSGFTTNLPLVPAKPLLFRRRL